MPRRILALAALAAAVALGAWGCQDYNFNPVGSCIIQPGQRQVSLAGTATADILFVVDDSGSMDSKQQALAQNFSTFIDALANAQKARVSAGLQPFEFHIAVTTSSLFQYDTSFRTTYPPFGGLPCTPGTAVENGPYPRGNFVAAGSNLKVLHFTKDLGWAAWGVPAWAPGTAYVLGAQATNANNLYTCIAPGTSAASGGPTTTAADITDGTVHWKYVGPVGPSVAALVQQFVGTCPTTGALCSSACGVLCTGGNIEVGSCGSGQEQHLEAGRLAIQKALAGLQPGLAPGEWPHPGAKMVVVFVGDEDDCSNPADDTAGTAAIKMTSYTYSQDSCAADKNTLNPPAPRVYPDGILEYPISGSDGYAAFFSGLGRPFGAAFIVAANRCTVPNTYGDACAPADNTTVQSPASCTGTAQYACSVAFAAGVRQLALARALEDKGISVVEGTVCENFGPILTAIADLVKPPTTLQLDSQPASNEITVLRIVNSAGTTQRVCTQRTVPGPPPLTCKGTGTTCTVSTELAVCGAAGSCGAFTAEGWWFANYRSGSTECDTNNPQDVAASPTTCIYINHAAAGTANACEANPGETYSAEYLGQLPQGGCTAASPTPAPSASCAQALPQPDGGPSEENDWWCYGPAGGTGTCVCRAAP